MAYRVFLSSTSKDLAAHREAVHRAIDALDGFELIGMEGFGARRSLRPRSNRRRRCAMDT